MFQQLIAQKNNAMLSGGVSFFCMKLGITAEERELIFFGLFKIDLLHKFHKGQNQLKTPYYDRLCEQEAHKVSHDLMVEFLSLIKTATESKEPVETIVCPI